MSHPLFFPGITYFYPIGNTSAVRLTEHLPPEQQANVLLLACGDPRHILYTVYTNDTSSGIAPQTLDVTCCDVEAAVLARNAILFALLADEGAQDRIDLVWNIFYHFLLDQESLSFLIEKCRELAKFAKDLDSWNTGPYARFLTVCDKRTLSELHRFWTLYAEVADYTPDHRKSFKKRFLDGMKEVNDKNKNTFVVTSSRSAGPLLPFAMEVVGEQFRKFWSTGVTDDGLHGTERATFVNPTFAFSMAGEKFAVHYGVDPVAGFHLAEVFATSHTETPSVLVQKLVRAARNQFSHWCGSVTKLLMLPPVIPPKLVVRMFVGDALRLCQAFVHVNTCGTTVTPILTSPWKTSRIEFVEEHYGEGASTPAPTEFNVIDTSNISDHVGALNLLVVTVPILSKTPSAMLYTESLLSYNDAPSADILERLCGDMQTMSLLLGIVPSAFLSQFTTRSNVHETLVQFFDGLQYHERIAWKTVGGERLISFAPDQLGLLLFNIYLRMFSNENLARQMQNMTLSPTKLLLEATLVHYTRRSFVQILHHIKSRVQTDWTNVMETFDDQIMQDTSLILGSNLYQEMCCHLYLLDIVTFTSMEETYIRDLQAKTKPTIFRDWESVPAVVTVVLVIPRNKIKAVESALSSAGTPLLQCEIRNSSMWNIFMDISAAYGRLETTGTGRAKTATIIEDKERDSTCSPLITVFSTPSSSLMLSYNATIEFRVRPSPRIFCTPSLMQAIFTAPLETSPDVHILAEPPFPPVACSAAKYQQTLALENKQVFSVQMDGRHTEIRSFVARVDITDPVGQSSLVAGSSVKLEKTVAHGTRLCIDKYMEKVYFPLPVDATNSKLRVARKSKYVEIIAPLARSMHVQNECGAAKRFFTILDGGVPTSWDVHSVNLDRCPLFKPLESQKTMKWLGPHVSLMFSDRERAVREKKSESLQDTFVDLKDSLHSLLLSAAGVQGPVRSVFALQNTSTGHFLAVILVTDLRLDVGSHTILADAWVAAETTAIQDTLRHLGKFEVVAIKINPDELEAWRSLLPLLVERCRTWKHKPSCEYLRQGTIPLHPDVVTDLEKSPFCSCGVGVGAEILPQQFKVIAQYVTRVAISPLFAVPYLEKVGIMPGTPTDRGRCKACGKQGESLSLCGKCKTVKYCSKDCQVKDWKAHKKTCAK